MSGAVCGRIGCESTASCVLLIAPQECEAWLVGSDHPAAAEGVKLCDTHADRITVPFGWGLHNERPTPKKRRRRKTSDSTATAKPAQKPRAKARPTVAGGADPARAAEDASMAEPATPAPAPSAAADIESGTAAPEPDPLPEIVREPILDDDDAAADDPTVQLPVIDLDAVDHGDVGGDAGERESEAEPNPAPADVPVRADHVAEAIAEADDPPHLQVVAPGEAPSGPEDIQPSLWDDAESVDQLEPTDRTPLLKRAFRVVRDD